MEINQKLYNDVISYSFLNKNFFERNDLVREVNPKAADRAIQTNIRDCSGSYMLEEHNTALFYSICMINDFIKDGTISKESIEELSSELLNAIQMPKQDLICDYNNSNYNIFTQLQEQPFQQELWDDMFELVEKGHYDVNSQQLDDAKAYYDNMKETNANDTESSIVNPDQQKRLWDKLNPMSTNAQNYLYQQHGLSAFENNLKSAEKGFNDTASILETTESSSDSTVRRS